MFMGSPGGGFGCVRAPLSTAGGARLFFTHCHQFQAVVRSVVVPFAVSQCGKALTGWLLGAVGVFISAAGGCGVFLHSTYGRFFCLFELHNSSQQGCEAA